MTRWSLLAWALVLLVSSTAFSLDCHFQGRSNWESLHLENLGGKFPLRCLKDRSDFIFLQVSTTDQVLKARAVPALREMLQQDFNTFSLNVSQSSWNESSVEGLLSGLYQQTVKTDVWPEQETGQEDHSSSQREDTRLGIKNYFQGIRDYLQDQKHINCAWEVIHVEMAKVFSVH
ncbi:PREDICTED: interferon beta-like [Odobenus rosmarus divergens]|uniref:Interferon beta-like n=1 Tax=Odobenus rosmarus divergens TaxID=9708 RepID=A0A2U3WBD7_ODORO|nr:PREDICTED: interferon beta-like [Odobenus rosmarus divergens]